MSVGKVLIIYGARRVGKTVLLKNYLENSGKKYKFVDGGDLSVSEVFSMPRLETIRSFVQGYDLLAIDEAQKIPNIGESLKLLVDHLPQVQVIATGSASFELSNKIGEPLTGRANILQLYPIAQLELLQEQNKFELKSKKEEFLVFGSYPEVLTSESNIQKEEYLRNLVNSYLLRDILELEQVKGAKVLLDLLRLLAFQVGNEVSLAELGSQLGIDAKTVARYLDLLEKSFVIVNLRGYSRNLRKEVTKKSKYYFCDIGVRNAVVSNFNPLSIRDDVGKLWENFIVVERIKKQSYKKIFANNYFWRTWDQKEIDLIEEYQGTLHGYEIKYSDNKSFSKDFLTSYPEAKLEMISQENYLTFIT